MAVLHAALFTFRCQCCLLFWFCFLPFDVLLLFASSLLPLTSHPSILFSLCNSVLVFVSVFIFHLHHIQLGILFSNAFFAIYHYDLVQFSFPLAWLGLSRTGQAKCIWLETKFNLQLQIMTEHRNAIKIYDFVSIEWAMHISNAYEWSISEFHKYYAGCYLQLKTELYKVNFEFNDFKTAIFSRHRSTISNWNIVSHLHENMSVEEWASV